MQSYYFVNTQVLMNHAQLDPPSSQIPEFRRGEEVHDDSVAYESMDTDGHFHPISESMYMHLCLCIKRIFYFDNLTFFE